MLSISVLGPLVVRRGDDEVRVPAGKTSELLVRLALEPGRAVRRDRLVEDLWGDDAVDTRPNTLQSKVAKLRRALGTTAIVSEQAGYRLAVEPAQIDAHAVLAAPATAQRLLDGGDDRDAATRAEDALSLFSGTVLASAGEAPWAEPFRARLEAARTQLVESGATARLRLGDPRAVVAALEPYVAEHPFHERLWALLATPLYRHGRPVDALAACQRARAVLVAELGLDPGPELQAVEGQILAHDDRLAGGTAAPGNLPALAVGLIGREASTVAVIELVRCHRLVEVVGPGGVGKTALAVAVARGLSAP